MLSNLRFQDGKSLEEVYKTEMVKERIENEQNRLNEIELQQQQSDTESEQASDERSVAVEEGVQGLEDALGEPDADNKDGED